MKIIFQTFLLIFELKNHDEKIDYFVHLLWIVISDFTWKSKKSQIFIRITPDKSKSRLPKNCGAENCLWQNQSNWDFSWKLVDNSTIQKISLSSEIPKETLCTNWFFVDIFGLLGCLSWIDISVSSVVEFLCGGS